MKKIFVLPLLVALALASCANPSDSGSAAAEAAQPAAPQAEGWPQISKVDFNVDLEGFEECPKDETYGINWVFILKSDVEEMAEANHWFNGEDFRLKPVEFHKSNPNGVVFGTTSTDDGKFAAGEGAYKCVLYRKPGDAGKSFSKGGCEFHYVPDGKYKYYKTEAIKVTRVASQKTKVTNGERFREVYKY